MSKINEDDEDNDEEIHALFNKVNPTYDISNIIQDENVKRIFTANTTNRFSTPTVGTAMRLGTSSGVR